jgi:regulatory protein YycH of two-component signal transduction system YycFG
MKRDTLKTIIALVVIGLIVVVTFLYGNSQRQAQLRRDQAAKEKTTTTQTTAKPKTIFTPTTVVPDTGGSAKTMPDTGATENALIPVTLIGLGLYYTRRSRRALAAAVRTRA